MGADGCHSKATNSSYTCTKLYTLTVALAHAGLLLPAYVIGCASAGHDASISRQGFRMTHLFCSSRRHARVMLSGLTTTTTPALLC